MGDSNTHHQKLPSKQFYVFSSAGKPIFAYHGSEDEQAAAMATAKALMSVAHSRSDPLRYIRTGRRVITFLDRSPLCMVAVSTLAEPPPVLRMQLALIHGQLTSLLTASALSAIFTKSPGFDVRRLLAGADVMLDALIDSFTASPAALLGAYPSLPLPNTVRLAVRNSLETAVRDSNAAIGVVIGGNAVASIVIAGARHQRVVHQWDVLLLLNFLHSNVGLREAETFTTLCLPSYNPAGHLHAYIHFLDAATSTALVLLVGGATPDHHACVTARQSFRDSLENIGIVQQILDAAKDLHASVRPFAVDSGVYAQRDGRGMNDGHQSMEECEAQQLLHYAYKLTRAQQFIQSSFSRLAGIILDGAGDEALLRREVVVAYSQIRAAMFDHAGEHVAGPLQTLRYEKRDNFAMIAVLDLETELYIVLPSTASKSVACAVAGDLQRWLKAQHARFFFAS